MTECRRVDWELSRYPSGSFRRTSSRSRSPAPRTNIPNSPTPEFENLEENSAATSQPVDNIIYLSEDQPIPLPDDLVGAVHFFTCADHPGRIQYIYQFAYVEAGLQNYFEYRTRSFGTTTSRIVVNTFVPWGTFTKHYPATIVINATDFYFDIYDYDCQTSIWSFVTHLPPDDRVHTCTHARHTRDSPGPDSLLRRIAPRRAAEGA